MPSEECREPATRDEAIANLRQAIAQLETAIAQLEAQAPEDFNLRADCAAVTASVERLSGAIARGASPEPEAAAAMPEPASALTRLAGVWATLVASLRRLLPATLSERLSDGVLSGVLVLAIALAALTVVNLLPSREPAPEVAKSPPELTAPAAQPTPTPTATPQPPAPVPAPSPLPKPSPSAPPLRLTPEQRLIAAIQDQVAEITNNYADGLIRSIRADFVGDRLIVTVTEAWYDLPAARQDRLASEMLQRSRQLDFSKLELEDPTGELLARSPVVGSSMVIFKRA